MLTTPFELRHPKTSGCRRMTIPVVGPARVVIADAFALYLTTWNRIVAFDHEGGLEDILADLGVGAVNAKGRQQDFILAVLGEYRARRAKASGPLRVKTLDRLSSIPVPASGPVLAAAKKLWRAQRVNHRNVRGAERFRRTRGGFVLNAPLLVAPRGLQTDLQWAAVSAKPEHIGLAVGATGLDMVVKSSANKIKTFHVDLRALVAPGFLEAIYRGAIASKACTVGLDVSAVPNQSGAVSHAATQLTRLLRTRQAAGAIVFRKVSTVAAETQGAREVTLKCPHCDAQNLVEINPQTSAPVLGQAAGVCPVCRTPMRIGLLLASRASAEVADAWSTYGCSPRQRPGYDRVFAAPSTTKVNRTSATVTTERRRPPSPATRITSHGVAARP
jgi:hypothetical protein